MKLLKLRWFVRAMGIRVSPNLFVEDEGIFNDVNVSSREHKVHEN